jgi:tRNA pseudouridine55 synthase
MNGVINVYKPQNMTSHDVVAIVRRALNTKKVGHTGTLDPMATGVLPVCVGRATKIVDFIQNDKKTYRATLILGTSTTTEDAWGEVIDTKAVNVTEDEVLKAVKSFIGDIEQVPPMYSALKVNGKKLYELARAGKTVERKARVRTIYSIEDIVYEDQTISFTATCSKGTYIRTLCKDIGEKLGTLAHMSALERTETGVFKAKETISIEDLKSGNFQLDSLLMPIDEALGFTKKITINDRACELIKNGVKLDLIRYVKFPLNENEYVLVYHKDVFTALAREVDGALKVTKLFDIN